MQRAVYSEWYNSPSGRCNTTAKLSDAHYADTLCVMFDVNRKSTWKTFPLLNIFAIFNGWNPVFVFFILFSKTYGNFPQSVVKSITK